MLHVLVVDDEPDIRGLIRRVLASSEVRVSEAATGAEAVAAVERDRIDVALLDISLPDGSGLDVLARLRATHPRLHVIMLTGASSESDRVLGLQSGADDYVVKPFSAAELAARVLAAGRRLEPAAAPAERPRVRAPIVSTAIDAVIVADAQLRIQAFNDTAEALYGWREDEVIGRPLLDVVAWGGSAVELDDARQLFFHDGRWHGEALHRRRDGEIVRVRSSATLLAGPDGAMVGLVSVNRPMGPAADAPASAALGDELDLADDIRRGVEAGEFVVHYQPLLRLLDARPVGVEALVRWQHPTLGLLQPVAFIGAAERCGAIVALGESVLEQACRQGRRWMDAGVDLDIAVNLSGVQLAVPDLAGRLEATLQAAGLPPERLSLEVTETSLVEDFGRASSVLHHVAELGVSVSIDDFGTGWASLTYLREFPVHALKIDRVFVNGLASGSRDTAIVASMISLGRDLGLSLVAEGIETQLQRDQLVELGCPFGQGFLYSRPLPAAELTAKLAGRADGARA